MAVRDVIHFLFWAQLGPHSLFPTQPRFRSVGLRIPYPLPQCSASPKCARRPRDPWAANTGIQ